MRRIHPAAVVGRAFAALACAVAALCLARPALALEEARLLRQPDIEGDKIVFVHAGDLWTVPRAGGVAARLTSHEGVEQFPKISPDGKTVAFTAEYDGNTDVYTVPIDGGEPTRLTWHPGIDQVSEWYPDGKSILFRTSRSMAPRRGSQFFKIASAGGFEEKLALPTGGYASWSADGTRLAYVAPSYDNRTWKRYTGGNAPDIWIYDFAKNDSYKITDYAGADEWPMWYGDRVYYASDQGGRLANLWCYDTKDKSRRQVTQFTDYDVKWPSAGSDAIVFECGGHLYVMDLATEKANRISVLVPDDEPATRPELRNVAKWITDFDLSPSAKRVALAARGDIFTVPAEHGDPRNLTNSPGSRERNPAWSPDGKWIAYLSDKTGEMEFWVAPGDGSGPARQVTKNGATFRYGGTWSPDSKKLAFTDKTYSLWWVDIATGATTKVDQSETSEIGGITWSGDSRWIAYTRPSGAFHPQVRLYSLASSKATTVSDDMSEDFGPSFDPKGRWLYFISRRTFEPAYGQFELDYHFTGTDKIYAASLVDTTGRPTPPRSDEEGVASADEKEKAKAKDDDKKDKKKDEPAGAVKIDVTGLGHRVAELPIPAGRYGAVVAFDDHIVYQSLDGEIGDDGGATKTSIHAFALDEQEDKTVVKDVGQAFGVSKDGKKVLYKKDEQFGIVGIDKENKPGDGKVTTSPLMTVVDPKAEWGEMFNEAWRLERDFYYDPKMGGLDWKAVGERYRALVPYAGHRSDMNYILGELIGELSTSHSYVGGGDFPDVPKAPAGLLGVDWTLDPGSRRYTFAKIYRARDWNSDVEAPLGVPGVGVQEGDELMSVNGVDVRAPQNLYAAFVGTVGKRTRITVSGSRDNSANRTYVVTPIADELSLRLTDWVASNREKVAKATDGRVAYVYVPNTAKAGIQEFAKQFYPQTEKDGIIVDERFNGGGFIPDFFVERLQRKTWSYWSSRDGKSFRTPGTAIDGPKCILINEYAGSGGDCFPYYFRLAGLGPVIGKRTWGGLVGIGHDLPLVDGGSVTMPDFGFWDTSGQWAVENHGVDPDIEVENFPHLMAKGQDPQLERAIQYELDELKAHPVVRPMRPAYKVQPGLSSAR
jgi:tricorn protease